MTGGARAHELYRTLGDILYNNQKQKYRDSRDRPSEFLELGISVKESNHAILKIDGKSIRAPLGVDILEASVNEKIYISSICAGRGSCAKCRVIIKEGSEALTPTTQLEETYLDDQEIKGGYRLACFTKVCVPKEVVIEVPPESRIEPQKMLVSGMQVNVPLSPRIEKHYLKMKKASLTDMRPDVERLLDALREIGCEGLEVSYEAMRELPEILRRSGWAVTAVLRDRKEVIWVEKGDTTGRAYGLAVDVGTTKIACYLVDLLKGEALASSSRANPQAPYGGDVASRVAFAMKEIKNLDILQKLVIESISDMVEEMSTKTGVNPSEVYDISVVGNTAMHHIFFGITPKYVGLAPYLPAVGIPVSIRTRDLGLTLNPTASAYGLPNIAGFVGADAVADILCSRIHKEEELSMLIDIGTNTEIILGNKDRLIACSTPAGPAIEGGHIKDGMRAEMGAIEHIWIDPRSYEPGYKVIGDTKPRGLCGSAIIDTVAHMHKANLIDGNGTFRQDFLYVPRLKVTPSGPEYVIARAHETATGREITFTPRDVREIQLVKAAIRTGTSIVLDYAHVKPNEIRRLYLAGGFGTYVDPQSARIIGLYPPIHLDRVRFVGNAAGSGAKMSLISKVVREEALAILRKIEYVELSVYPNFMEEFMRATYIPYKEDLGFPVGAR